MLEEVPFLFKYSWALWPAGVSGGAKANLTTIAGWPVSPCLLLITVSTFIEPYHTAKDRKQLNEGFQLIF